MKMKCISTCQFRGVTQRGAEIDIDGDELGLPIVKHNFTVVSDAQNPVSAPVDQEGDRGKSNGAPKDDVKKINNLTIEQVKEKLTLLGVKFDPKSRKEALLDMLIKAQQVVSNKQELPLGEGSDNATGNAPDATPGTGEGAAYPDGEGPDSQTPKE